MAGIYLHIPFCKQKCHYCNFFSIASLKYREDFLAALLTDIELEKEALGSEMVETIYFGGGTPSLLSANDLDSILNRIHSCFTVSSGSEITLEVNPEDMDVEKIRGIKALGFNRISIGVQSFFEEDLRYLSRNHDGKKALEVIRDFLECGFQNLSVDLIYGIPTLTSRHWTDNLEQVSALGIPHLSAYWLTIEEKTALEVLIRRKRVSPPDEDEGIEQFHLLHDWASDYAYEAYEISNFCKSGMYSRHNRSYWEGRPYLGLGPSAHSFNGSLRKWKSASLTEYIRGAKMGQIPAQSETLSTVMRYQEMVMTGLRTRWGVDLKAIEDVAGRDAANHCLKEAGSYLHSGHLFLEEGRLKLSRAGILLSDQIMAALFMEDEVHPDCPGPVLPSV